MSSIESSQLKLHLSQDMQHILDPYQLRSTLAGCALWSDATLDQARAWSQLQCIVKKYNDKPEPAEGPCKAALEKFIAVNRRCGEWKLDLRSSLDELLIGEVKASLYSFWFGDGGGGSIVGGLEQIIASGRVGKGNSVLSRFPDFFTKMFDGPHSTTSADLKFAWDRTVFANPHWRNAERTRQSRYGTKIVAGNQLSFVNKNVDVARCISKEPIINMWFQLGFGSVLESRLQEVFGISLSTQPKENGEQARLGSLDGSFCTIDLESASDSIGLSMLEQILPREWLAWLKMFRSPKCRLPGNRDVSLEMISTMGNGFTFPLETVIFSCVVHAVYRLLAIPLGVHPGSRTRIHRGVKNFGVFGDDIIVVKPAFRWVVRLLELLGFSVNSKKTFVEGPFRESCGEDWFNGQPCRPVYIKRLGTAQDIYVAINTLNRWSAMTKLPLRSTIGWLRSLVSTEAPLVPWDEGDTAGIHVPSDLVREVRRGPHGEWQYRKDTPRPVSIVVDNQKWHRLGTRGVLDNVTRELAKKGRKANFGGLHVSFIGGYIRGGRIIERTDSVTYATEHTVTPCWDYNPDTFVVGGCRPPHSSYYGFAEWSSAVRANLS